MPRPVLQLGLLYEKIVAGPYCSELSVEAVFSFAELSFADRIECRRTVLHRWGVGRHLSRGEGVVALLSRPPAPAGR